MILKVDKNKCFYCDTGLVPVRALRNGAVGMARTKEHIVPKSKGGSSKPENLVYACSRCNGKRGNLDLEEFLLSAKHPYAKKQIKGSDSV